MFAMERYYAMKLLIRVLLLWLAMLIGATASSAQTTYSAGDPRWSDENRNNDPNTCHEPGKDCKTQEEWINGWCEARVLSGLSSCDAQQPPPSQPRSSSDSNRRGSSSSSSDSVSAPSRTQASAPQSTSSRRGNYRLGYDCPYGKVCVGHWPSGDIEVYDSDNCCWDTRQAIDTFNVYD